MAKPNSAVLPENFTWVSPYITVADVEKSGDFYHKAFQFQKKDFPLGEDGTVWHGEMQYKNQMIMLGKAGAWGGKTKPPTATGVESPINLYIYCEDVDDFYKKAVAAGAKSLGAPEDMFWGDRMCRLEDIDGYTWAFATKQS